MSSWGAVRRVVAYVPDLMDRSRLARLGDVEVVTVADLEELARVAGDDDLVVVDLGRPGAIDAIRNGLAGRVVGFASHVDTALIEEARAAGCDEVMPRSAFFARLPHVVGGSEPTDDG